jgi:hypothetical protein
MLLKSPSKQKCNLDWLVATAEHHGRTPATTGHMVFTWWSVVWSLVNEMIQ